MAWNATYDCERHGDEMKLDLDLNREIIGNPPTRLVLNPLGNQYIVNGYDDNGKMQWRATYNCENHGEVMKLELDFSREIIDNPPAHLELNLSGNQYIVNGSYD